MSDLVRHPWNTSFVWEPRRPPFRIVSVDQAAAYDRDGYFVLEGAIAPAALDDLRISIDPFEARTSAYLREHHDGAIGIADADAITFTTHLVAQSRAIREFAAAALWADLCADLIGPDVRVYWDQAVYKKPEPVREFPWHQDNGYTFVLPQQYLTCWIPLVDATLDNGCPWVVPGLHVSGTLEHHWTPNGFECLNAPPTGVAVPARTGDVVVFSSLTPHRTGPNLTDSVRAAYILQFAPDDAFALRGDPRSDAPPRRERQDAADRQFRILRNGRRMP
jgi:phytanoyl-CoA hydroxylase